MRRHTGWTAHERQASLLPRRRHPGPGATPKRPQTWINCQLKRSPECVLRLRPQERNFSTFYPNSFNNPIKQVLAKRSVGLSQRSHPPSSDLSATIRRTFFHSHSSGPLLPRRSHRRERLNRRYLTGNSHSPRVHACLGEERLPQ
jgi:hypothetical protein